MEPSSANICSEIFEDNNNPTINSLKNKMFFKMVNKLNDIFYIDLFVSLSNLFGGLALFWVDLIPNFGYSQNLSRFQLIIKSSIYCSFGAYGCGNYTTNYAIIYLIFLCVSGASCSLLLVLGEESALLSMIINMVTPIVVIFWILFSDQPPPIHWMPRFQTVQIFSIVATIFILPAK
ncbi:hypothetical protein HZS_7167 [Henneguya salminicola]|nr:hypothetical protein HZS_7167 [Henneguya salminicola]